LLIDNRTRQTAFSIVGDVASSIEELNLFSNDGLFNAEGLTQILMPLKKVEKLTIQRVGDDENYSSFSPNVTSFSFMKNLRVLKIEYCTPEILKLFQEANELNVFQFDYCMDTNEQKLLLDNFLTQQKNLSDLLLQSVETAHSAVDEWKAFVFKLDKLKLVNVPLPALAHDFISQQQQLTELELTLDESEAKNTQQLRKTVEAICELKKLRKLTIACGKKFDVPQGLFTDLINKTVEELTLLDPSKSFETIAVSFKNATTKTEYSSDK